MPPLFCLEHESIDCSCAPPRDKSLTLRLRGHAERLKALCVAARDPFGTTARGNLQEELKEARTSLLFAQELRAVGDCGAAMEQAIDELITQRSTAYQTLLGEEV